MVSIENCEILISGWTVALLKCPLVPVYIQVTLRDLILKHKNSHDIIYLLVVLKLNPKFLKKMRCVFFFYLFDPQCLAHFRF